MADWIDKSSGDLMRYERATMQRTKRRLTHSKHEPADSQPGKELGKEDMMKWCLMSSDVRWHIRDKLRPMPKHGKEDINHLSAKYTVISYKHSNVRQLNTQ